MSRMQGREGLRVLIKLSGEALMGSQAHGIDPGFLAYLAQEIREARDLGGQFALVIGGGNIFRGVAGSASGMERSSADTMGMLATVMNAIALQNALEQAGVEARVQSALAMPQVVDSYNRREAVRLLEGGGVVIFAAGTGNPYFTTDTAASLRAAEIGADLLLKGTKVDGVYSADPRKDPKARRYQRLTYEEVLAQRLNVMDLTAITLCRENRIPIVVFSILDKGALKAVLQGEQKGTWIEEV